MIHPAYASALQGLTTAQRSFQRHAEAVARSADPAGPGLRPDDMVGLLVSQRGFEANLAVLSRADDMVGTLLDTLA